MPPPLEDEEQKIVVEYCDLRGYPRFRVPNETYTKSWKQKTKNATLGVSAGVPDLFILVSDQLIFVEMKRTAGSSTSTAQKAWIAKLNNAGIPGKVCKGANEAIEFIEACRRAYERVPATRPLVEAPAPAAKRHRMRRIEIALKNDDPIF